MSSERTLIGMRGEASSIKSVYTELIKRGHVEKIFFFNVVWQKCNISLHITLFRPKETAFIITRQNFCCGILTIFFSVALFLFFNPVCEPGP